MSSSDSKKNISCVTQVIANKIFEMGVTLKISADLSITQYLITNHKLICDYYDDYLEYQTGLGEVLSSYRKSILFLPFDNGFLKLISV